MSDETSLAYQQAKSAYQQAKAEAGVSGQDPAGVDSSDLVAKAQAHVTASEAADRPLEMVLAEYALLLNEGVPDEDRAAFAALGQELGVLREAAANVSGNLPSSGHAVGVGIGG